jgi:GTP cyclohydrolase I
MSDSDNGNGNDNDSDNAMQGFVRGIIHELGEDPDRDGLVKTPSRVAAALRFFTQGYERDPVEILNNALFEVDYDEMVVVRDIDFYSLCEHHMVPFFGRAHVAYIPNGKVVGLSKLPRLVEMFSRRLQVQERFTMEVAGTIERVLQPKGVGVVVEAKHLCMMMRGVEKQNCFAVTSSLRGLFNTDSKTRAEFMELIRHPKNSFA